MQIDVELIKLFSSSSDGFEIINLINQLLKSKVLNTKEEKLCNAIIEGLELTNSYDLKLLLEDLGCDINMISTAKYLPEELIDKVDEFIVKRKDEENFNILQDCLTATAGNKITKEATDLIFNRYVDIIDIPESYILDDLETIEPDYDVVISSAIEVVDNNINGLKNGTITTIIGNEENYKSLWAINIAYKALSDNKNVLYITPNNNQECIYKRLISRHSCNSKFNKSFSYEELCTAYDESNYKIIYNDFKNSFQTNLQVHDELDFNISSSYNLLKLITHAQKKFIKNTGEGIDLIIIDDFSFMRIDTGKHCVTSQSYVVNEYYRLLRNQARNLLGTNKKIPILTTISPKNISLISSNILGEVCSEIKSLSHNIFCTYGNNNLTSAKRLEIHVLQSYSGYVLKEYKEVEIEMSNWYIKYNNKADIDTKILLEEKEQEINNLKQDKKELEEQLNEISIDFS